MSKTHTTTDIGAEKAGSRSAAGTSGSADFDIPNWFRRHQETLVHATFIVAAVVLIILLAWGIAAANFPATMVAGCGLAVAIVLVGTSTAMPDNLRSEATERTLRLASNTLYYMSGGLTPENCEQVCRFLLPETQANAISMTDRRTTLAYIGEDLAELPVDLPISQPTKEVLESGHMQTYANLDASEWGAVGSVEKPLGMVVHPIGIIAPLIVANHTVGTLKLYYRHGRDVDRTQLAIARGFSALLSTQLYSYEMDRQATLTARAEIKALQAQINPHFLFNTLNTIASFTRTDPTKARNLLREFSSFYRYTLESSRTLIPIFQELEQTRRYLKIEKARFGSDRIIETERVEKGCESLRIPGFLIQPIVENSVRHAMRDEGPLHIDIQVVRDGDDVMIAVADDGLGMGSDVAQRLLGSQSDVASTSAGRTGVGSAAQNRGAGVALSNVAERIEHFFGVGSGAEIMSREGEGTVVTLRLVNAASQLDDGDSADSKSGDIDTGTDTDTGANTDTDTDTDTGVNLVGGEGSSPARVRRKQR